MLTERHATANNRSHNPFSSLLKPLAALNPFATLENKENAVVEKLSNKTTNPFDEFGEEQEGEANDEQEWVEEVHKASGRTIYRNTRTGKTQWVAPETPVTREEEEVGEAWEQALSECLNKETVRSDDTRRLYRREIRLFRDFVNKNGARHPKTLTSQDYRDFQTWCKTDRKPHGQSTGRLSKETIDSYAIALRSFGSSVAWIWGEENVAKTIKIKINRGGSADYVIESEMSRFLSELETWMRAPHEKKKKEKVTKRCLLVFVLYYFGARKCEAIAAKYEDFEYKPRKTRKIWQTDANGEMAETDQVYQKEQIVFHIKNGKGYDKEGVKRTRDVPCVDPNGIQRLKRLICDFEGVPETHVFASTYEKKCGKPIDEKTAHTYIKKLATKFRLEIDGTTGKTKVSTHWFRHSIATHLANKNFPMRNLKEWMGHRSEGTTKKFYVHKNKDLAGTMPDMQM